MKFRAGYCICDWERSIVGIEDILNLFQVDSIIGMSIREAINLQCPYYAEFVSDQF